MKTGMAIYQEVCVAAEPAVVIRGLADAELEQLGDAIAQLPDSGFPGVTKGQVLADQARRWRVMRAAEREREES